MTIEQSTPFLTSVLRKVRAGRLVPAAFQRPYVWQRSDVEALADSLLSGFPMGSIVVWAPDQASADASLGRGRLGPMTLPPGTPGEALLLDGQNRLATLAWMMRRPEDALPPDLTPSERAIWDTGEVLVADVNARALRFMDPKEAETALCFPAWALFHDEGATECIRNRWAGPWAAFPEEDRSRAVRWFDEARGAVADARIVETLLNRVPLDEARHAFLRICKVGVPMSEEDFDAAMGWKPESVAPVRRAGKAP